MHILIFLSKIRTKKWASYTAKYSTWFPLLVKANFGLLLFVCLTSFRYIEGPPKETFLLLYINIAQLIFFLVISRYLWFLGLLLLSQERKVSQRCSECQYCCILRPFAEGELAFTLCQRGLEGQVGSGQPFSPLLRWQYFYEISLQLK